MQQLYHYLSVSIIKVQKGRNLHDSLINTVQQLYHRLSVSIIKVQKGTNLHDSLINTVQQSYIIICQFQLSKFQKGQIFIILSLAQCNSYIIICQFQLSKFKKGINKLSNCNNWLTPSDSSSWYHVRFPLLGNPILRLDVPIFVHDCIFVLFVLKVFKIL